MAVLVTLLLMLVGVVVLAPVADRFRVLPPVVLAAYGVLLALVPGIPALHLPPALVLPLLLPPLLFAAAQRSSTREFARQTATLIALAVGLVIVTTATVAATARLAAPELGVAAGVTLGALVSPPDPVAATSLAGRLCLPRRLVAALEGEGLLNDTTALVVYTVAVTESVGAVSVWRGVRVILVSVLAAPLIGHLVARAGRWLLSRLSDPRAEVGLTLLLPYPAYLLAVAAGGSGVLAAVVCGVYMGQHGVGAFTSSGRLAGATVWSVADWFVSGFTFALVGFQLTTILRDPDVPSNGVPAAIAVCATLLVVRFAVVFPLGLLLGRRRGFGWREPIVAVWAGLRGVVTVATALALPAAFPNRPLVQLIAIVVVAVTLLGQGLTLPMAARLLGVRQPPGPDELAETRRRTTDAALTRLAELESEGQVPAAVAATLREDYRRLVPGAQDAQVRQEILDSEAAAGQLRDVERAVVLELRHTGAITAATAEDALRDIDLREQRAAHTRHTAGG